MTINEDAIIDDKCAEEGQIFWSDLRKEPYGLLVNNKYRFSYSFMGAQKIGEYSLERKTAILVDDPILKGPMTTVLNLKKMFGTVENRKVFQDRDEAIKWLETN